MLTRKVKFLVLILIFIFSINIISVQSFADKTSSNTITTPDYSFDTQNGTITGYLGSGGDVEIPNQINGIKVTGIGRKAFFDCSNVTSVIIPNSVTSIGDCAFLECTGLKEITIPNSVTSIGDFAFEDCSSLTAITIPNGVSSIGFCTFVGCISLTEVNIPASVSSIDETAFGGYAFIGCKSLLAINVDAANANYCSINGILFDKTQKTLIKYPAKKTAASYIIPKSVTDIGVCAFEYCTGITEIIIPDGVTSIGTHAFKDCINLKNMILPGSITKVGESIFRECSLTELTISKTLKGLWGADDEGSLAYCNIKNLIFEEGTTAIEEFQFVLCNVENLTIPSSVTSIGDLAFWLCRDVTIYTYPGSYADEYAQSKNIPVKYLTPIPEDINADRVINMEDVILVASHFNTSSSESNYDIKCDLNSDGVINMIDILVIATKFNYIY
jgi:hypothetical protein